MSVVKGLLQEIKTPWCQLQCPDVTPSDKRMLIDRVRRGNGQRERDRQREQSVLESVTLALTQCHESPHHYSSNCTGTLFKLKHIPEAECQQKDAHYHTCTRALCTSMHTWDSYWLRENELTTWILLFRPVIYQVRSKTVGGIHLLKTKNNTKPGPWICLIYRNFDRNHFNVE